MGKRLKETRRSFKENIGSRLPLLLANGGKRLQRRLGTSQTNNESPGAISFVSQTIVDIGRGPVRFTTTRENEVEGGEARFEQA